MLVCFFIVSCVLGTLITSSAKEGHPANLRYFESLLSVFMSDLQLW